MKKIKNSQLKDLQRYMTFLLSFDFSDFEDALKVADESVKVDSLLEPYEKVLKQLQEKVNTLNKEKERIETLGKDADKKEVEELNQKYSKLNEDHTKLLEKEVEFDTDFVVRRTMIEKNNVKVRPADIKLLMNLNMFIDDKLKKEKE